MKNLNKESNKNLGWSVRYAFKYLHVVGLFLLPLNVLYRLSHWIFNLRLWPKGPIDENTHLAKRLRIQQQVKKWDQSGRKKTMCTARPKTHSIMMSKPNYRDTLYSIDMNDLNDVIGIDTERLVVKVEPLVNMGQLMEYLLPLGWTLPIVPEIEALTVGGLIMGGGLQSSSHKYGLFHRTCRSYELITSNGEAIQCSKDENPDLFYGIPVSYGTLGFLTAVEIDIIKASRYVKVEYYPAHNYEDGLRLMETFSHDKTNHFVEPILYSKNTWVVMKGHMVDAAEKGKVNHVRRWYKPWFFKHVESFLKTGYGYDYIPLLDFYFRHSRCLFWHSVRFVPYGNHPIFRWLLGWSLPINIRFLKKVQPIVTGKFMFVQDYLVHAEAIIDIILESDRLSHFYPVWFCPVNFENDKTLTTSHRLPLMKSRGNFMIYDIGFYGIPSYDKFHAPTTSRRLEEITMKHNGFRGLYTDTYMTKQELTTMFNLDEYEVLRKKYEAEDAFPHIYSKISLAARINGL